MIYYKQIIGDLKHMRDYSNFTNWLNESIDKAIEMIELLNSEQTQEDIQLGRAVRLAFEEGYNLQVGGESEEIAEGIELCTFLLDTIRNLSQLLKWYAEQQKGKVE